MVSPDQIVGITEGQNILTTPILVGNNEYAAQHAADDPASMAKWAAINVDIQRALDTTAGPGASWVDRWQAIHDITGPSGSAKGWLENIVNAGSPGVDNTLVQAALQMGATKVSTHLMTAEEVAALEASGQDDPNKNLGYGAGTNHGSTAITSACPIYNNQLVDVIGEVTVSATYDTAWIDTSHWVDTIINRTTSYVGDTTVPNMRQKAILLYATGLKPFTRMYANVDGTNLDSQMVTCPVLILSNVVGEFLGAKELPVTGDNPEIRTMGNTIWPFGEFVDCTGTNCTAGQTMVVVAHFARLDKNNAAEEVLIVLCNAGTAINDLTGGFKIKGRRSGATATVTSAHVDDFTMPTAYQISNGLTGTTDSLGNLFTRMYINDNQFPTGVKTISLTDNAGGNYEMALTKGRATFFAQGTQHNYQQVITHTNYWESSGYNQTYVVTPAHQESVVTGQTIQSDIIGYNIEFCVLDPLSQTFTLPEVYTNGAMIHSIDLFFYSNNDSLPVIIQLVGTTNGYPNTEVYASTTLYPADIKASNTKLVATNVPFYRLIYLEPNKEYAVKVISNSNKYRVWVSKMGEIDIATRKIISKQPSMGSLFMSQNNSTWTADQYRDLAFNLNVAKFDTSKTGTIDLFPQLRGSTMYSNPFYTTAGSTRVRVTHFNHGLLAGNYVTYSNAVATVFNASYKVEKVTTSDSYTINLGVAATTSESCGGSPVYVDANQVKFDLMRVAVNQYTPPSASLVAAARMTNADMVINASYDEIPINKYWYQNETAYIISTENESKLLNGSKSFTYELRLQSNDTNFSPIVDLAHIGVVAGTNRAAYTNQSSIGTTIFAEDVTTIITASAAISFAATTNTIASGTADFSNFIIGRYILISGSTSNSGLAKILTLNKTAKSLTVDKTLVTEAEAAGTITIKQYDLVCDSIVPQGDLSEGVYLTTPINLTNRSSGLKIIMDSVIPAGTYLDVYYRSVLNNGYVGLAEQSWSLISISIANNESNFTEREYNALALDDFNAFQVKLVMRSDNSAKVPQVKNLRIIAVA